MKLNKKYIEVEIEDMLRKSVSNDFVVEISEKIVDYVYDSLIECADCDFNDEDLKYAVGKALCKHLGISV